jgi:hypothetical protein
VVGLGFFALRYYIGKRTRDKLAELVQGEEISTFNEQEQARWKQEVLLPITRELFNHIKTTGLLGYRSDDNTRAYLQGIELLLITLQQKGVVLDPTQLSVPERRQLLNHIVEEVKLQLVTPHALGSTGWCLSFIRPTITPAALRDQAPAIASAVAMTLQRELPRIPTSKQNKDVREAPRPSFFSDNSTALELEEIANTSFPPARQEEKQGLLAERVDELAARFERIEHLLMPHGQHATTQNNLSVPGTKSTKGFY